MGILEHLESHAIKDIFYDVAGPFCPWMSNPGFDFFVIEKHQPCILSTTRKSRWKTWLVEIMNPRPCSPCNSGSVLGRGTSLVVSNATAFSHRVSDDLPSATRHILGSSWVVQVHWEAKVKISNAYIVKFSKVIQYIISLECSRWTECSRWPESTGKYHAHLFANAYMKVRT